MSDLHPITCPDLLKEAESIIRDHEALLLLNAVITDLTDYGVTRHQLFVAVDVLDYFRRLRMVPRPESALPIFLGLEGEAALNKIIARWSDESRDWGER